MIAGAVNADCEAVIRLRVQGPAGHAPEVDGIIDTGFNGFLTLPPALVTALGLTRLSRGRALLANGSEELFDIYSVTVLWDGQQRYVEADAVDTTPLVGMSLLDGYDLHIQVAAGGQVTIQASDKAARAERSTCFHNPVMQCPASKRIGPPPKVLWVRLGNCTTADIEQALRRHHPDLLNFDANEVGAFLIVGIRRA